MTDLCLAFWLLVLPLSFPASGKHQTLLEPERFLSASPHHSLRECKVRETGVTLESTKYSIIVMDTECLEQRA